MNLHEFREYRDSFALDAMLKRGRELEGKADAALKRVHYWQRELAKYPAPPTGLQYTLTREQFDARIQLINIRDKITGELDTAWREWAYLEAMIGDIERDPRYLAWRELQRQTA